MKKYLKHLAIMVAITGILLFGLFKWLDSYTGHDEPTVQVPDLTDVFHSKAARTLESMGLEPIYDDTVYQHGMGKLNIVSQNSLPGSEVKLGRKVYLVINSDQVPKVRVPDLAGKTSLKQARNILKRRGLELGNVKKIEDESVKSPTDEPVLAQYRYRDSVSIEPGTLIDKFSKIDLLVGEMPHSDTVAVEPEVLEP